MPSLAACTQAAATPIWMTLRCHADSMDLQTHWVRAGLGALEEVKARMSRRCCCCRSVKNTHVWHIAAEAGP